MTVEWTLVAAVVASAILHASWNAITKASSDPLLSICIVTLTGGVAAACAIPFVPFPGAGAWPYLLTAVTLHSLYQLALVRCYALGDLSQVYPIARGLAPLGVAMLALGAGEVPTLVQTSGLLLASGSIVSFAWVDYGQRHSRAAVTSAVITAILISSYTVVDGLGVRAVERELSYIAWVFFLDAFPMLAIALHRRRHSIKYFLGTQALEAVAGGCMATLGYGVVLWALSRGPMAPIAALRETSVIFAALIGTRLLGEAFGRRRLAAACALAIGLALARA